MLHKTIEKGVCDLLVELISDRNTLGSDRIQKIEYLDNPENLKFILSKFKRYLFLHNLSKWMYNGGAIKDRPYDMGYSLGYKICKSYYERSVNMDTAIIELLNTEKFENILLGSEYGFLL